MYCARGACLPLVENGPTHRNGCAILYGASIHLNAPVAQRIERLASNQEVVGSNPAGGTKIENIEKILFIFKAITGGSPPEADKESLPAVGRPPGAP